MHTLLLTHSETEVLLEPDTLLADRRAAFSSYSLDRDVRAQRVRSALPGPGTATVLFLALEPIFPPTPSRCAPSFRSSNPQSVVSSVCTMGKPAGF